MASLFKGVNFGKKSHTFVMMDKQSILIPENEKILILKMIP